MTKHRIAAEDAEAVNLIPPAQPDGSGIGVNFTDAYIKVMNTELEDGRKVSCKRKGLKITLQIGDSSGEAIMNRLEYGPDVEQILRRALESAATAAGAEFTVEDGVIYLQTND
jgi:hypothetical protein